MNKTNKTPKWERDPDCHGDRYAPWCLMPAGTSQLDEQYVEPIATVMPAWEGSSRMSGAPSGWRALVGGRSIGRTFHGVKEAKAAVEALLATTAVAS